MKLKNKIKKLLLNKYFWIILIPDLFILYFIIKYSFVLFVGWLTDDSDLYTAGAVLALIILKGCYDIYLSINKFKENN